MRCHMLQTLSDCRNGTMATIVIKCSDGNTLTLRAFDKVVNKIANLPDQTTPTAKDLLRASPFAISFADGIVRSVRHT